MRILLLLLALATIDAPRVLAAQQPAPEAERTARVRRGPVEMLLRDRERLRLSEDQVVRLQAIGQRMEDRNQPLVGRLLEMRRQLRTEFRGSPRELAPVEREEYERRVESARPLLREIRENNRAAMREVGEVLTPEQKEQVREIVREHRKSRGANDGNRRRGRGR